MAFEAKSTEILLASDTNNMSTSLFSLPGNVTNVAGYAIQAVWSNGSTPVGSMNLQASNDSVNWSDIPNSTLAVSGNTGNNIFNTGKGAYYNFVRLVYTRTSGDGNLLITLVSKS